MILTSTVLAWSTVRPCDGRRDGRATAYSTLCICCRVLKSINDFHFEFSCCMYRTIKLSYRKYHCAMRLIHGYPENLRVWVRPQLYFLEIFNGLLFRSILWMCTQNLKFVTLPVPEITGRTQKRWVVPGYAHTPFSPKFLMGLCSDRPCECTGQIWIP